MLGANLNGTFLVTRAFLPAMLGARRGGRIINISSIAGRQGTPMLTAYCAAKHGVVGSDPGAGRGAARRGHRRQRDLPGLGRHRHAKDRNAGRDGEDDAEDVARVALFLAAEAPPALTGACIDVFG